MLSTALFSAITSVQLTIAPKQTAQQTVKLKKL
jgi:hypothetical protein